MQISGIYSLQDKTNTFLSCTAQYYADHEVVIYAVNGVNDSFAPELALLYKEKGTACVNEIDEMFLAVVSDLRDGTIHIFADITTSALNVYYTVKDGKLFYSTSLKWLLKESKIVRNMNLRAAKAFMANGYVFGSETLVQNVYKMQFGCEITVEMGSVVQKNCPYSFQKVTRAAGKKELLPTIQQSIAKCVDKQAGIYMPLSGGFDSNMILNTVRQITGQKVHAFTVGGKEDGKNEIGAVKKNISYLENVELHESFVDTSFYNSFSDIVWRLEGFVFESGVFLQYALARSAKENGATYLICGEGSDETQSIYYQESLTRAINGQVKPNEKLYIYSDPFVGTNMLILKKSSLMLNSFGIVGKYPFKHKHVSEAAMAIAKLNGTGKKYYKKQCKKVFLPEITANLKTTGGTTGNAAAVDASQMETLARSLSNNALIAQIEAYEYPVRATGRTKRLRRRQYLERGWQEIKDLGILKGMKKARKIGSKQEGAKLLKQAYLVIFNELFVTGKYDEYFSCEAAPVKTDQIIKG